MVKLILMRHGQSQWNYLNLFTGWVDIPLSTKGVEESLEGGRSIKHEPIDIIFTSTLIRAQMTAMLAMTMHDSGKVPVILHPAEGHLEDWGKSTAPWQKRKQFLSSVPGSSMNGCMGSCKGLIKKSWLKNMERNKCRYGGGAMISLLLKEKAFK